MARSNVYFDQENQRLVYIAAPADEAYWDNRWANNLTADQVRTPYYLYSSVTRQFLPKGAKVLDAGCGIAHSVFTLKQAGYDAYGIDFATSTVTAVNRLAPELQVSLGDVRNMPFPDEFFDGVWSPGVIEHFYEGFDDIAEETARVLRLGGYAFVTVPSMSRLRILKARLGLYRQWHGNPDGFYQFALSEEAVTGGFTKHGFSLVHIRNRGGFIGLKEEVGPLRPLLQAFYDSKMRALRAVRVALDKVLAPLTSHTKLYVFRKV